MECSSQLCRDGFGDHYSFYHRKVANCNLQYTRMGTAPCAMQHDFVITEDGSAVLSI